MFVSPPDLAIEKLRCREFLEAFASVEGERTYQERLQRISNREVQTLDVALDDVYAHFAEDDPSFVDRIQRNAKRYVTLFAEVADELMPAPTRADLPWDIWDEFMSQAQERHFERKKARMKIALANPAPKLSSHPDLHDDVDGHLRGLKFEVLLKPMASMQALKLRAVDAQHVGRLIKISGVVAQVSEVRPLIRVATYVDTVTGIDYYQEVLGKSFMPLHVRPVNAEQQNNDSPSTHLEFLKDHSKFISYQEIKVQENQDEVPEGTTPRSLKFTLRGNLTRRVKPGDHVELCGICIAQPYAGASSARPGLLTSAFVETTDVRVEKLSYADAGVSNADLHMIQVLSCFRGHRTEFHGQELSSQGGVYTRLARSIAPEIHGHVDLKKALLLMMVGGVTKEMADGIKLRGDIHVCLMGDPGVAKSQLLKFIANVSPRSVYTTGKGSSGVGLTASVVREEGSGEACLEGGALVLADKGICCIDEFDKMEEGDRTAIHEVMEQQTVSIAKAGITTTLNARSAILAAANPAWGRYNTKKSPAENIALPPALLSRFDVMWLILDKAEAAKDKELSEHVLHVHRFGNAPPSTEGEHLTSPQLRAYVAAAKTFSPIVPESLSDYIAGVYASMRQENLDHERAHTYTTPRTLMSILRLCQALAKLQFRGEVIQDDVEEALRLMRMSKISLMDTDRGPTRMDPISAIYRKMNAYWKSSEEAKRNGMTYGKIRELCSGLDVGSRKVKECIEEYSALGIITLQHGEDGEPIVFFVCQYFIETSLEILWALITSGVCRGRWPL